MQYVEVCKNISLKALKEQFLKMADAGERLDLLLQRLKLSEEFENFTGPKFFKMGVSL